MALLIAMDMTYLVLLIVSTVIVVKAKSYLNAGNMTRQSDNILVSHFIFLELAIFFKLIVITLYIGYAQGYIRELPVKLIRIFYNASFVYLYVACSLGLYKWLIIIIRAKYYGGYLTRRLY